MQQTQASIPTLASTWRGAAAAPITDELLDWPPDAFAFANVILGQSEAFRFVLSPIEEWPPRRYPGWVGLVEEAALAWSAWVEGGRGTLPELVLEVWGVVRERADTPLEDLAEGRDQLLCESLLTLHAVADEACAGLGVALDTSDAQACLYRARGRELLVRTGSMARVDPRLLRVLPKVRTPPTGHPAFSRYACTQGPGIAARWHKMPSRHRGTDLQSEYATLLLLPWPLRVRASDFRPIAEPVHRADKEPFGFFEFTPDDGLDFELLDGVLHAARQEAGSVDVVCLPESAVDERELDDLESLLHEHGVANLQTGVRQHSRQPGRFPGNWIHIGFNPAFEKGTTPGDGERPEWFHIRQDKHHRWSLDDSQIYQYHLGGSLHPGIHWWEAMDVPRRSMQFLQVAELTLVAIVCEDLSQNGHVAELIRSVGPTLVLAGLLDGPQLTSRWAARYASVLADDPGSAVLTLTSYGMVQRSRPHPRDASPVVALWKDPSRGVREIPLDAGAHAVLLTVCMDRASRRSADGRWPIDNGTACFDVAVHQIRAAPAPSRSSPQASRTTSARTLEADDVAVLTGWAEAVAEALVHGPDRLAAVLSEARSEARWRSALMLAPPSARLGDAMDSMGRFVLANAMSDETPAHEAVLAAARREAEDEQPLDGMVRRAVLSMLEERLTRRHAPRANLTYGRDGTRSRAA
jgi:hypothetical protein